MSEIYGGGGGGGGASYTGGDLILVNMPDTAHGNGKGGSSTYPAVIIYSNIVTNTGTALTYTSNATTGDTIVVNTTGLYAVDACLSNVTAGHQFAISVNETATQLGTLQSYDLPPVNVFGYSSWSGTIQGLSGVRWCIAGDTFRVRVDPAFGNTSGTSAFCYFRAQRIA